MNRRVRKRKNKKYTFMVLPHSTTAPKSLKIPQWAINGLAIFGLFSLVVFSYLVYSYIDFQETIVQNTELKVVNSFQANEIENLQRTTEQALNKLEEIIKTDIKVRELVGLAKSQENETAARSQGGFGTYRRNVQTLGLSELDLMTTYERDNSEPVSESMLVDHKPNLDGIDKVKYDLEQINTIMEEQEEVLAKLETDVKNRLDYLASVPTAWPLRGRITSDYGWRRNPFNYRTMEFHDGLDIAASYGTAVKASGDGKVIFAGWKPAYGYTVVIRHGYGYTSQYGHNSTISIKVGQEVKRGDIIARVGSTGRSTGPHVDFRIIYNGRYIDPEEMLN